MGRHFFQAMFGSALLTVLLMRIPGKSLVLVFFLSDLRLSRVRTRSGGFQGTTMSRMTFGFWIESWIRHNLGIVLVTSCSGLGVAHDRLGGWEPWRRLARMPDLSVSKRAATFHEGRCCVSSFLAS